MKGKPKEEKDEIVNEIQREAITLQVKSIVTEVKSCKKYYSCHSIFGFLPMMTKKCYICRN